MATTQFCQHGRWSGCPNHPKSTMHIKLNYFPALNWSLFCPPMSPPSIKGHTFQGAARTCDPENQDCPIRWLRVSLVMKGMEKDIRELGEFSVWENYRQNLVLSSCTFSQRKKQKTITTTKSHCQIDR